ncbi:U4/U6.U5 small nuclear ribonucleoprotein 27 kDa protein-like [Papaver somniferum]|uniref:U4/U6.U5 small nuclear ribonucleoprotein 27 kDa protein-like n=1 Tax=Papaver somniferum TaxID=3469 RepID=UPI000E702A11|nr:U4/U6.U5 small nuclear ribonucleoprotein 27 kDa protein-like [Papaver somniferum]
MISNAIDCPRRHHHHRSPSQERKHRRDDNKQRRVHRDRSPSQDRKHRCDDNKQRRVHRDRFPSQAPKRRRVDNKQRRDSSVDVVSEFVDGIVREQNEKNKANEDDNEGGMMMDDDEIEMMMKILGMPVGFDSTKGKPVLGADVSGIRLTTKRQPRQYMNRRGGFNRPLPLERNR